ncbi:CyaA Adenylate cyclase, family 3 (some proteins contain HAMP domain) [Burkholderiaceae bacterium]
MNKDTFDLYDREKALISEGSAVLESQDLKTLKPFAQRLFEGFVSLFNENQNLLRHSDRQEQRLVKLNQNLKAQTQELELKRQTQELLSQQLAKYLPPQIMSALLSGTYQSKVATQRKKLTVFFSDIRDFTATSDLLQPEALTEYLNEYFSEMTEIAMAHGATIDKYIGDAMMVFFGDPESKGHQADAQACVLMAMAMQARMKDLAVRWKNKGFENPFVIRIGINTGYCNVGNFGSDQRLSYTIIGGEVNLTQRLEAHSDPGGILMSYETYCYVQDLVEVEERQPVKMKGIARDVKTFAVLGLKPTQTHKTVALSHQAGVNIDLDVSIMTASERQQLAQQLRAVANQIS